MKKGVFITFEGGDGCGKSTQAGLLASALKNKGYKVVRTREPGGSLFCEHLRKLLLDPEHKVFPLAELMLYEASRAGHTAEVIRPALDKGHIVICERYSDATIAYQGYGRGLNMKDLRLIDKVATGGLKPDVTIYMKLPSGSSLGRIKRKKDRLELEKASFHKRVNEGYKHICASNKKRVKVVDAAGSQKQVHDRILRIAEKCLKK
ncbi:MAG: dTMP kinase [Elusimicrobia bacterium HGW-Elusimicrobia-2]|nr:MAG: dTMP kinase [Elusimicrobia bacterium HGW-Elusimicrobia-2]